MVELELMGEVGTDITIDQVRAFLNENKSEEINFKISTLGGDLGHAITIYNLIKAHPKATKAEIIGLTASAGTVISSACDSVVMNPNTSFLIHNGWTQITGNTFDLTKGANDLEKNDAIMIRIYKERTGLAEQAIRDLMKASNWLSPNEALSLGFVDKIEDSGLKIAALIAGQKAQLNKLFINKLQEKMKNPFKKEAEVMNVLALKDGAQVLINAEEIGTGVEVAPLGALTLEDGEYELADGRKISVSGGVVTQVQEEEEEKPEEMEAFVAEVVESVGKIVAEEVNKIQAQIDVLKKASSSHTPPKGKGAGEGAGPILSVSSKVKEVTDGIHNKIKESRQA